MYRPVLLCEMKLSLVLGLVALVVGGCTSPSGKTAEDALGTPGEQIQAYIDANDISNEQTTSTGLVYVIEEPGGPAHPTVDDRVTIHYVGYLVDGTVFDQTRGASSSFALRQLIPAWQEALPLIGKGGKIKILAPPNTAYGINPPRGTPITAQSVLVFDIALIDF